MSTFRYFSLVIARILGRGHRRAEAAIELRKLLHARVAGVRPRALDLRLGGERAEGLILTRAVATRRACLDTAGAAEQGLASVREKVIEWETRSVYRLDCGLIHGPTGMILDRGRHLVQSGPAHVDHLKHYASDSYVAEELWLAETFPAANCRAVEGTVHHTGMFSGNYYHWLVDVLPRVLHARTLDPDVTVVLPEAPRFATDSLDALGVRWIATTRTVYADAAIVVDPRHGWLHPDEAELLRRNALALLPEGRQQSVGVYVSRRGSSRSLIGEDRLEAALEERGFLVFDPHRVTAWTHQIEIFANCRIVVGPHGAGLANIIFSPADARLIELLPDALNPEGTPGQTGHFLRLATVRSIDYSAIRLERTDEAHYGDVESVIERVLQQVDRVC